MWRKIDTVISVTQVRTPRHEAINEMKHRSGRLPERRNVLNHILWVPAQAPEPAGNELLIVLFVILAAPPCSLLVISNYGRSLIKNTLKVLRGSMHDWCVWGNARTWWLVVTGCCHIDRLRSSRPRTIILTDFEQPRGRK